MPPPHASSPKFFPFLKTLNLIVLSLALSLLSAEGMVRLYQFLNRDVVPLACRQEDRLLNHSLVPNSSCRFKTKEWDVTYSINSLGMRDQEYSPTKPSGAYRILLLGDSFAEGYGVEERDTYQNILEDKLNDSSSRHIEVLNAGVQSYSPELEYFYLLHKGLSLSPDLVIINLDLTDFSDEQRYQAELDEQSCSQQLEQIPTDQTCDHWRRSQLFSQPIPSVTWLPFISSRLKWWFHHHSRLYDLSIKTIKKRLRPDLFRDLIDFTPSDSRTDSFVILRNLSSPQYEQLWQPVRQYLLKISALLSERHIPLIIFMHPHGHQLSTDEWTQGRTQWDFAPNQLYSTKPQQDLSLFADNNLIAHIDLLPPFREFKRRNSSPLFFPLDGHLTPVGHQVVADTLFKYLKQDRFGLTQTSAQK